MALCKDCNQEMLTAQSCSIDYDEAKRRQRIRFGHERWSTREWAPDERCHDCGVVLGGFHHPGCDMEKCAACGEQRISCSCTPNPTWQCPRCKADLEQVGVVENRVGISTWTHWKHEQERWDVGDEDTGAGGVWSLACQQCQTDLPFELSHDLWNEIERGWSHEAMAERRQEGG